MSAAKGTRKDPSPNEVVAVSLPVRHWITVMASLQLVINDKIIPATQRLKEQGKDENSLSDAETTALSGPFLALGEITKTLHARGHVTDAGNERIGEGM